MKIIICGDRNTDDYSILQEAAKQSGFKITEVVSGGAKGADALGEKYAKDNKIKLKVFKAEWDNLDVEGAKIKERINPWTKKVEKYNASAGFNRNSDMVNYADAVIALQPDGDTSGTQDTIKKSKEKGIPVFVFPQEKEKKESKYKF